MDPRRLLTFRAVANERSFSRAAESLSITQPSVSHAVALLETEVGVRLLDRARGGLRLTPAGAVLLVHADQIAWRLALADTQVAAYARERREHLRLGAFPTALASLVPATVAELRRIDSELQVRIGEVTPGTVEERLLSGEFDVAVTYQDTDETRRELPGCERIDLLQERFLLCLPPRHRLARSARPVALRQLAGEDWIFASTDGFLVQACRDAGFEPRIVATTTEPLATRGLVMRGIGVGWVPSLLAGDYDGVAVRPVRDEIRRRDIYALLPPGDHHPRARQVADALRTTAAARPSRARVV
ncbi:hypothetical protein DSM112329_05301 [Paraconexibacter sp. AEG42_29]|uniref:HTH lysR-type domain-containing protein n=1 Tax=Paraconexibacter sp. AEG42_29 TaxID=2997339 RepID=A0AAU7B3F7_9ACTN